MVLATVVPRSTSGVADPLLRHLNDLKTEVMFSVEN